MRNPKAIQYAFKRASDKFDSGAGLDIQDILRFFKEFDDLILQARGEQASKPSGPVAKVSGEAGALIRREASK